MSNEHQAPVFSYLIVSVLYGLLSWLDLLTDCAVYAHFPSNSHFYAVRGWGWEEVEFFFCVCVCVCVCVCECAGDPHASPVAAISSPFARVSSACVSHTLYQWHRVTAVFHPPLHGAR